MSTEEMNRKIAEACGLKKTTKCGDCYGTGYCGSEMDHEPCDKCKATGKVEPHFENLPDYCNDLNACHEAEKILNGENQRREYVYHLAGLMKPGEFTVLAPAHQRALAFLRTLSPSEKQLTEGLENRKDL